MKYRPKTKPFPHQSRATIRAVRQRNHAVFFEPRLGKSKVALDYVGVLALKGEISRVLILAPRIALDVWDSELQKHFPYSFHAETFTHEWLTPARGEPRVEFFLAGREETFRATRVNGKLVRPKQDILQEWRPHAIIVDESHEYKRPGGRGAQDLWRLVTRLRSTQRPQPYVLLLTGTPSAKGWRDLFAQFRIMDPALLGTSVGIFDEEYCVYGYGPRKYTVIRYRRLEHLQSIIDANSTSCTADQAGLEGQLTFQTLHTTIPPKVREVYDELAEHFVTEIDGQSITASNVGVKRLRLLQLTSGYYNGQQLHDAKIRTARDWLALLHSQGQHVVIYCRFTAEVDALRLLARGCRFQCEVIDGRTSTKSRAAHLKWFQSGQGPPRSIIFQYQAGSRAIELTAAAEVLFVSLPDGWVDFFQCLNRVRGPNQNRPVRITAICARGTVDTSVYHSLQRKEDMHNQLLKSPKRFLFGLH